MVIDTSALVAVLTNEIDASKFKNAIDRDTTHLMSAASVLEAAIVLQRRFGETGWSVRVTGNYRITFGWSGENALDIDFEDYH